MNRLLALTALLVGTVLSTCAQTFYEVSYKKPGSDDYYMGLLTYVDDAHCKMRVVAIKKNDKRDYFDANYECEIRDNEENDSTKIMLYKPDDKKHMPVLAWVLDKDDTGDQLDVPFIAFNVKNRKKWAPAISFREVTVEEMVPDFLLQYFTGDESDFEMLMMGNRRALNLRAIQQEEEMMRRQMREKPMIGADGNIIKPEPEPLPSNLHLIVTANTNVSDIGVACMIDLNRIRSEFAGISKVVGLQLKETIIANNGYSRDSLVSAIKNLHPAPSDVVVFVYSGHGFRFQDQKDYYPNMDLSPTAYDAAEENYLPLSLVYDSITVKGARLNIVLSDCCNSEVDLDMPLIDSKSLFSRANKNFDRSKMRTLFLNTEGNVIATAASPGEVSWCGSNGGFFLLSVIESLRSQVSVLNTEPPTWERLVQNAIDAAAQKSETNSNCKKQNGLKYVKVKSS